MNNDNAEIKEINYMIADGDGKEKMLQDMNKMREMGYRFYEQDPIIVVKRTQLGVTHKYRKEINAE